MIVQCNKCDRHFDVPEDALKPNGRNLKCASCGHIFFQAVPEGENAQAPVKISEETEEEAVPTVKIAENLLEDETLALSQTESDEWATPSDALKEIDLDGDRELNELLGDTPTPADTMQQKQAPAMDEEPMDEISMDEFPEELSMDEDAALLATPETDEWATTSDDLKEIDLENSPELRELEETDEASDQETLLAENSVDEPSHFQEEAEEDSWSDEEDPWPDEDDELEENETDLVDLPIDLSKAKEPLLEGDLQIDLPEEEETLLEEVLPVVLSEKVEEIPEKPVSLKERMMPAVSPVLAKAYPQTDGEPLDKGRWADWKNSSKKVWAVAALLLLSLSFGLVSHTEWGTVALVNARSPYRLLSLESQWRQHSVGGLLLVQGEVENNSRSSAPPLVYISLMDKDNHVLLAAQSIPGRVVDIKILDDTGQQAIREIVSLQGQGRTPAELTWKGKTMPFQAVFVNPPEEAAHFQVDFK